jgi:glycosyltransferase involved in cell wall biosynthesis
MRILMLLSNPFTNDARVYNEAMSLIKAGHDVTVIAFDRNKRQPIIETWDGIQIYRIRSVFPQRYYLGTPVWNGYNPLSWQWQAYNKAMQLHKKHHFHVIHCHDFDTLVVGVRIKKKLRIPLVYDAHEMYSYMMERIFPHRIANIFIWLEKRLIADVDRIITVSETIERYLQGITNKPISVIMNCKMLQSLEYEPSNNADVFHIIYVGLLNEIRAISLLIDVVEKLDGIRCTIGGIGQPDYVKHLKERCNMIPNIDFIGIVPLDQVISLTKRADIIFCLFNPEDSNSAIGTPNKLFEAMICGRPIICTKGTYSGDFTEKEDVGLTIEYTEEALKQAIIKLRDDQVLKEKLGRNALKAAISKYNWQKQEKKLLEIYEHIDAPVQPG